MKCSLDGGKTRVFAKAVQSLAKFGPDLFIESGPDAMQLRALNSTRSAVGTIRFKKNFFDCYEVDFGSECYCKLGMRACLTVFRCTKHVERCDMNFSPNKTKFQIQLKCRLDTIKNTMISIDDEENITANMSPDFTTNVICGHSRVFSVISNNFNSAEEEITLQVLRNCVTFKNYVEGSRVTEKFMRSQLKYNADEFETYNVKKETSITFCLKEFRAFLLFAEALNETLLLRFDEAGSPAFIEINRLDEISCILIMSTLSLEELSICDEYFEDGVHNSVNAKKNQKRRLKNSDASNDTTKQTKSLKRIEDETTLSNSSSLFNFENSSLPVGVARIAEQNIKDKQNDCQLLLLTSSDDTSFGETKVAPPQSTVDPIVQLNMEKEIIEENDCILSSPSRIHVPHVRSIFSRCFDSTYIPKEPSSANQIYAPASDTED